jgi:hypothetical protein
VAETDAVGRCVSGNGIMKVCCDLSDPIMIYYGRIWLFHRTISVLQPHKRLPQSWSTSHRMGLGVQGRGQLNTGNCDIQ